MENNNIRLFKVGLHILKLNNKNCIEIRRATIDPTIIKIILDAAFYNQPIIVFPDFKDRLLAVSKLMDMGILKYDYKENTYQYLI